GQEDHGDRGLRYQCGKECESLGDVDGPLVSGSETLCCFLLQRRVEEQFQDVCVDVVEQHEDPKRGEYDSPIVDLMAGPVPICLTGGLLGHVRQTRGTCWTRGIAEIRDAGGG